MPNDGLIREYNWEDIICLILNDMELPPKDRRYHELRYHGNFQEPQHAKDTCISITKYVKEYGERLEENVKDKI